MPIIHENAEPPLPQGLAGWLVRKGVAKTARGAEYLLVGIAICAFILAGRFLFASSVIPHPPPHRLPPAGTILR